MSNAATAALLKMSEEKAELTCTFPTLYNYANTFPGSSLTLHGVLMILGGCMGIVSILIALYLLLGHVRYFTRSREQQQLMRIIVFIPFLTVTSWLSLAFPNRAGWIAPIGDYYESFAISALYLFYCQVIISPDGTNRDVTFAKVRHAIALGPTADNAGYKDLGWLRISWFLVLQIAVTRIITLVANEILYGVTCPTDPARKNGSIAIIVIQGICTGCAVVGVIGLERRTHKTFLRGERPTFKLFSFKAIIGLQALQQIIFTALAATGVFLPAPPFYISFNDFSKGFPYIIFLFEILIIACMFLWSFEFSRYKAEIKSGVPRAKNPLLAFLSILIPLDIFKAAFSGLKTPPTVTVDDSMQNAK